MNIQPIVEGHGEVSAIPLLLRRLRDAAQAFEIEINAPIRRKRSELVTEKELRKSVALARLQADCSAILVVFDSDKDCPKTLVPQLQLWASDEAGGVPCAVVMAHKEYEAWFLAAIESLRGVRGIRADAESHADPESPRGAKAQVETRMESGWSYSETADQAAMSARIDLETVYRRSRSFRKLVKEFGILSNGMGFEIEQWPPSAWVVEP